MTSRRWGLVAVLLTVVGVAAFACGGGEDGQVSVSVPVSSPATTPAVGRLAPAPVTTTVVPSSGVPSPSAPPSVPSSVVEEEELVAPALRQRPQIASRPGVDPATVTVVAAPTGDPTPDEFASPTAAAAAWAARWCPFTHLDDLGAAESRARAVMTAPGWASFDPRDDPVAVGAWAGVTAAGLAGTCAGPGVVISPEAPRSESAAYVTVTLSRVLTSTTGATTVETVTTTRLVVLQQGRWLVDTPAQAG